MAGKRGFTRLGHIVETVLAGVAAKGRQTRRAPVSASIHSRVDPVARAFAQIDAKVNAATRSVNAQGNGRKTRCRPLRWIALLMVMGTTIGAVVAWWARFVAPIRMQAKNVAIQLPRKHPELQGRTIAFVTDTHVGPHFRASDLAPVVDELQKLQRDLVLFGGDFICESPRFMPEVEPVIGEMARTGLLGAWGVMGDHDLANLRERVVPPLEEVGVVMLHNQALRVDTERGNLWLVGVDDARLGEPDLEAAYRDVPVDAASI